MTAYPFPPSLHRTRMLSAMAGLCALTLSPAAIAQSNVTIYGVVDAGIGRIKNGGASSTPLLSGIANGSRLGFRGREDLGNGLSAIFVMEQGLAADTGTLTQGGLAFGRQAYVGLSSNDGWSLTAGRQLSPIATSMIASDPMSWQYVGNTLGTGLGLHESAGETPGSGGFQATSRIDNSVLGTYKKGAIVVSAMVGAGNEDARGSGRLFSGSATYSDGPLLVTAAFTKFRQHAALLTVAATPQWQEQYLIGASYDFGFAKVSGGWYRLDPATAGRTAGAPTGINPRFERSDTGWLGARVPVPTGALLINFMRSKYQYNTLASGHGTSIAGAYEHTLSKRTSLYASYGRVNNNATGLMPLFAAIPAVIPTSPGAGLRMYAVGVRHVF